MKRIQYCRYGGVDQLQVGEVERPTPGHGQVLVRVEAASVNPMDGKIRRGEMKMLSGRRFPRGLGHDFAGTVIAVGADVKQREVGDKVMGVTEISKAGAFAEAVIANEQNVALKPSVLSFERAAAITIVGLTAWIALVDKAKLRSGQTVFINGCLGSVGRAAVQIARMRGASIVGSCGADGLAEARTLGVGQAVDYRTFAPAQYRKRFDAVFDTAGTLSLGDCSLMLKQHGASMHIVPTLAKMVRAAFASRHHVIFCRPTPEAFAGVTQAVESGALRPTIGAAVALSDAIEAIARQETAGLPKGKLVIVPST